MYQHPDLLLEQARLQQAEWHRQAERDRLSREARKQLDREKSSPLLAEPHQIGQERNWRAERALYRFLRAVFPTGTIEYLASTRGGERRTSRGRVEQWARAESRPPAPSADSQRQAQQPTARHARRPRANRTARSRIGER